MCERARTWMSSARMYPFMLMDAWRRAGGARKLRTMKVLGRRQTCERCVLCPRRAQSYSCRRVRGGSAARKMRQLAVLCHCSGSAARRCDGVRAGDVRKLHTVLLQAWGEARHANYGRCASCKCRAVLQTLSRAARQRARVAATYRNAARWRACCGHMSKASILVSRHGGDRARTRRMTPCQVSDWNCPEGMSGDEQ